MMIPLLLIGCGKSGVVEIANGCDWVQPIYIVDEDMLSNTTATQILRHNEVWHNVCFEGD